MKKKFLSDEWKESFGYLTYVLSGIPMLIGMWHFMKSDLTEGLTTLIVWILIVIFWGSLMDWIFVPKNFCGRLDKEKQQQLWVKNERRN